MKKKTNNVTNATKVVAGAALLTATVGCSEEMFLSEATIEIRSDETSSFLKEGDKLSINIGEKYLLSEYGFVEFMNTYSHDLDGMLRLLYNFRNDFLETLKEHFYVPDSDWEVIDEILNNNPDFFVEYADTVINIVKQFIAEGKEELYFYEASNLFQQQNIKNNSSFQSERQSEIDFGVMYRDQFGMHTLEPTTMGYENKPVGVGARFSCFF